MYEGRSGRRSCPRLPRGRQHPSERFGESFVRSWGGSLRAEKDANEETERFIQDQQTCREFRQSEENTMQESINSSKVLNPSSRATDVRQGHRIQQKCWTGFSRHRKSLRNPKIRRKTWSQSIRDRNPLPTMEHRSLERKVPRKSKILQHGYQGPKAKMKAGIRFCDLAEWKKSGIGQHHDLLGKVRKKAKTTRYLFRGHKGGNAKVVCICSALDR